MARGQYWFNTRTHRVETDDDRGPVRDLMGPYPSRAHAEHALERARRRTQEWDEADRRWAAGELPAWAPRALQPDRLEYWVADHPRGARAFLGILILLSAASFAWTLVGDDGSVVGVLYTVLGVFWWRRLPEVERRVEQARAAAAATPPP